MKNQRIIAIVIAILVGTFVFAFLFFASPAAQTAIHNPPTEEHYELLKEEALRVAKTLDKNYLTDETLTANLYFSEDELVVIVESVQAKLTARIPIENYSLSAENNTIKFKAICEFENVEYEKKDLVESVWFYFALSIAMGLLIGYLVCMLLFAVCEWLANWNKSKSKKHN